MHEYCYLNGKIIPSDDATLHISDGGILRGYGIFDFMGIHDGEIFLFDEHWNRFQNSAKKLNLRIPLSKDEFRRQVGLLLRKNKMKDCSLRAVLNAGRIDGLIFNPETPTFFIFLQGDISPKKEAYEKGVKLMTAEHLRLFPEAKTSNYIFPVLLQGKKKKAGAYEILYTWEGNVLEASTCNFCIFKGDTLITPQKNILQGITRYATLKLARDTFEVEERELSLEEVLSEATEAFITSTGRRIVPVTRIDAHTIGDGVVGENTKEMMSRFKGLVERGGW
ncbi:MAG: aminotransferase class IV family protein [Parcubacteria group bacterium]|nr:aminotransferase class IV family protein [Parcubacteria group bacterium]